MMLLVCHFRYPGLLVVEVLSCLHVRHSVWQQAVYKAFLASR